MFWPVFWREELESLDRARLERLQLERLQELVIRLQSDVPHYREQLGDFRIRSLDDLASLPFTTKQTLRECHPFGLLAVPLDRIVRVHTSSTPPASRPWSPIPISTCDCGPSSWRAC